MINFKTAKHILYFSDFYIYLTLPLLNAKRRNLYFLRDIFSVSRIDFFPISSSEPWILHVPGAKVVYPSVEVQRVQQAMLKFTLSVWTTLCLSKQNLFQRSMPRFLRFFRDERDDFFCVCVWKYLMREEKNWVFVWRKGNILFLAKTFVASWKLKTYRLR